MNAEQHADRKYVEDRSYRDVFENKQEIIFYGRRFKVKTVDHRKEYVAEAEDDQKCKYDFVLTLESVTLGRIFSHTTLFVQKNEKGGHCCGKE